MISFTPYVKERVCLCKYSERKIVVDDIWTLEEESECL